MNFLSRLKEHIGLWWRKYLTDERPPDAHIERLQHLYHLQALSSSRHALQVWEQENSKCRDREVDAA